MATKQEVEVTYQQLFTYNTTVNRLKPKADDPPKTKLEYAIDRNRGEVDKWISEFAKRVNDINRENASTEKKDDEEFLKDKDGNMIFTKEANKKINDEIEKLRNEKIKLNVYHSTSVPKNISPFTVETLQPISISPSYEIPMDKDLLDDQPIAEPQKATRA